MVLGQRELFWAKQPDEGLLASGLMQPVLPRPQAAQRASEGQLVAVAQAPKRHSMRPAILPQQLRHSGPAAGTTRTTLRPHSSYRTDIGSKARLLTSC